jgi:hypothetical protein
MMNDMRNRASGGIGGLKRSGEKINSIKVKFL